MFRSSSKYRKLRFTSAVIALALVASACAQASSPQENAPETTVNSAAEPGNTDAVPEPSSPAGDDEEPGSPAESASAFLDLPANPLPVTFSTDDSASISAEIGTDGGSLVTTDVNGVVFTLTIPDGALLSPAMITMTPVALTDSPFEGASAAAVSLEPDGLVLMEPATLTISKSVLDATTSVFFSSDNGGGDFGVVSGDYGDVAEMAVPHFSLSGTFGAPLSELSVIVSEYRPSSRDGRYRQEIQTLENRVDDLTQRYNAQSSVLIDWYNDIAADARSTDDEATVSRLLGEIVAATTAHRRLPAYDLDESTPVLEAKTRASLAIQTAVSRLFDKENLRCIQDRNPDAMFTMFRWFLLYTVLTVTSGDAALQPAMETATQNCAQFRVEFRSTVELDTLTSRVRAEVTLKPSPDGETIGSNGLVELPIATGSMTGTTTGEPLICGAEQPIDVGVVLVFDANVNTIADATLFDPLLSIWLPLHLEWTCENMPVGVEMTPEVGDSLWKSWFVFGFSDLRSDTGQDIYRFDLERDPSGSPFAAFDRSATIQGIPVTVEVILIHDPQLP